MKLFLGALVALGLMIGGAFAQSGTLVKGVQYNAVAPTFVEGQVGFLRGDVNGNLLTTASLTGSTTPSDNFANPTTATTTFALGGVWDGATWDRLPGTSADGVTVNLGANNDVTITSGTTTVTQATGTNLHVVVDTTSTTAVTQATGTNLHAVLDSGTLTTLTTLTGTTTLTPGTGAANLGKAEDAVHGSGDTGVMALGVANTGATSLAANGDYIPHAVDLSGAMYIGCFTTAAYPCHAEDAVAGSADTGIATLHAANDTLASLAATGDYVVPAVTSRGSNIITGAISTLTTSITRPADTNVYAANDALANSTSAPTSGGFTFTSACVGSGGFGKIKSAIVSASAVTAYQGEIWIFDQSVTATNDNAALSVSDADILNIVGVIPFNTTDVNAANSISYVTGLDIGYTCVGTANLRFLVKILNTPTPGNAEVLNFRLQVEN